MVVLVVDRTGPQLPPAGFSIVNQYWEFEQNYDITGGFTDFAGSGGQPSAAAGGSEAADPDLGQSGIKFYFRNFGIRETVAYHWTLSNGDAAGNESTADFNIQGPTGNILPNAFLQTNDTATVLDPATLAMKMSNSPAKPGVGIWINDLATLPRGNFIWVQIINSTTYSQIPPTDPNLGYIPPSNLGLGVDGIYPYPPLAPFGAADSPGRGDLFSFVGEVGEAFDATMYVLWDPALPDGCTSATTDTSTTPYTSKASTCTSTPVPLASVQWKWSACAINGLTATNGVITASWFVNCGPGKTYPPTASEYPEWNSCDSSKNGDCRH
jgi:hypothetical protein